MASFYVIRGKDNGQHFAIRGANASIGREATNQIQLRDTEVSRKHASIVRIDASNFEIVDNGSSNGTFVNSRRVESQKLRSGDRVQVGRTLMIFTGGPEPYSTAAADSVQIVPPGEPAELSHIRSSLESQSQLLTLPVDEPSSQLSHHSVLGSSGSMNDSSVPGSVHSGGPTGGPSGDSSAMLGGSTPLDNWEIVYRVSQAINRTVDLNELLAQVLDLIFDWIACDRGCILMNDETTGNLRPIANRDAKQSKSDQPTKPMRISRTILDHVVANKEGVLTDNAQDDSRWESAESVASLGVREAICVPMLGRYGAVGVIYVDTSMSPGNFAESDKESLFDEEHLKLLLAIAGQAALAIEDTQFYHAMMQSERLAVMGQTIANMSHHVKNILQGVSGGNYLVESGIEKNDIDVIRKGWSIVSRNQQRVSDLVMDMLSFSKSREPDLQAVNLTELLDDVIELSKPRAQESQVALEWSGHGQRIMASCDAEGIHRAVLNVVTNAIDAAADAQNGRVAIEVAIIKEVATVSVTDNGSGIESVDQQKIFAPFESSKGSKGTGLGLPVSQKILREHGGDITVNSQPGHGANFILHWPANHQDESGGLPTITA